jgi:hypothetical protein
MDWHGEEHMIAGISHPLEAEVRSDHRSRLSGATVLQGPKVDTRLEAAVLQNKTTLILMEVFVVCSPIVGPVLEL